MCDSVRFCTRKTIILEGITVLFEYTVLCWHQDACLYTTYTCFWLPPNAFTHAVPVKISRDRTLRKSSRLSHLLHICQCAGRPAPVSASRPQSDPPAGHWWWSASTCLCRQSQTDLWESRTRARELTVCSAISSVHNSICTMAVKLVSNNGGMFQEQVKPSTKLMLHVNDYYRKCH